MKRPSPCELRLLRIAKSFKWVAAYGLKGATKYCNGTFYTAMRRLNEAGYVRSKRSPWSGREVMYQITAKGRKVMERVNNQSQP